MQDARIMGVTKHGSGLFKLFDAIGADVRVAELVRLVYCYRWSINFSKALMAFFIEKSLEVEDLPTLLAREIVGQLLQLVQQNMVIVVVVVVEHSVQHEAVVSWVTLVVGDRLIE